MSKSENKYMGMSMEELLRQETMYKQFIDSENEQIQEHKEKVKVYKSKLQNIEEAKQAVNNIQTWTICEVEKTTKSIYVGNENSVKNYYVASDWREYVWYKVYVYSCNVNDRKKSRTLLWKVDFAASEKSQYIKIIIEIFKKYKVKKIVLGMNDKFPITTIKKEIKDIKVEYVENM